MTQISDADVMAALAGLVSDEFTLVDVTEDANATTLVRFMVPHADGTYGVRLPLPSSSELKPWLTHIPRDAVDAANLFAAFLDEEVATGCTAWAVTTDHQGTEVFQLEPYGFRTTDQERHQRLTKAAGPDGWFGRVSENDVPRPTRASRRFAQLPTDPFTYPEVGATAGTMPAGYRHLEHTRVLGTGAERFTIAVERLMIWDMHRRAGLLVGTDHHRVTPDAVAVLHVRFLGWWIPAPVRVVAVVEEERVRGFAYGTLPGHPERGEERFLIHHDPDDTVRAQIRAFSRPGNLLTRIGRPVGEIVQDRMTRRYLNALAAPDRGPLPATEDEDEDENEE